MHDHAEESFLAPTAEADASLLDVSLAAGGRRRRRVKARVSDTPANDTSGAATDIAVAASSASNGAASDVAVAVAGRGEDTNNTVGAGVGGAASSPGSDRPDGEGSGAALTARERARLKVAQFRKQMEEKARARLGPTTAV